MIYRIKVFINYAKEDEEIAKQLFDDLRCEDIEPWLDQINIEPGENWRFTINQAIRNSNYFIALISKNSLTKKGYVQKELKLALDLLDEIPSSDIFIIPVRAEECVVNDERVEKLQWVDLFPSYEDGLNKIIDTLLKNTNNRSINCDKKSKRNKSIIKIIAIFISIITFCVAIGYLSFKYILFSKRVQNMVRVEEVKSYSALGMDVTPENSPRKEHESDLEWSKRLDAAQSIINEIRMFSNNNKRLNLYRPWELKMVLNIPDNLSTFYFDHIKKFADIASYEDIILFFGESPRTINIKSFYIDKTEVSVKEYVKFLDKLEKDDNLSNYYKNVFFNKIIDTFLPSSFEKQLKNLNNPITNVNWYMAAAYCDCINKRLPTLFEFEYLMAGINGNLYPFGNDFPESLLKQVKSNKAKINIREVGLGEIVDVDDITYQDHRGLYHILGNVSEWVSDPRLESEASFEYVKGGNFEQFGIINTFRYYKGLKNKSYQSEYIGFRCASDTFWVEQQQSEVITKLKNNNRKPSRSFKNRTVNLIPQYAVDYSDFQLNKSDDYTVQVFTSYPNKTNLFFQENSGTNILQQAKVDVVVLQPKVNLYDIRQELSYEKDNNPIIDIRIANFSDNPIMTSKFTLEANSINMSFEKKRFHGIEHHMEPSGEYDVSLLSFFENLNDPLSIMTAQSILPKDVDRFIIKLGLPSLDKEEINKFLNKYPKNNKIIRSIFIKNLGFEKSSLREADKYFISFDLTAELTTTEGIFRIQNFQVDFSSNLF